MHIFIISQSMVNGILLKEIFKRHTNYSIHFLNSHDQNLFQQFKKEHFSIDLILFDMAKYETNLKEKLEFLINLFGCKILLLGKNKQKIKISDWIFTFTDFPLNPLSYDYAQKRKALLATVKNILEHKSDKDTSIKINGPSESLIIKKTEKIELIAIGASTGGPQVLVKIFSALPASFSIPILTVQHIPAQFMHMFVDWLNQSSALQVELARNNADIKSGHIYIAPGNYHLVVTPQKRMQLVDALPEHHVKPSVSYLFKSVAEVYGQNALGVLLTGMGKDGAAELASMKAKGAITIVQSKESCAVFGMPKAALELGAATAVLPPEKIIQTLIDITKQYKGVK